MGIKEIIQEFLETNPTDEEIELFYVNKVLPHDKRSITEIMTHHQPVMRQSGTRCWACDSDMDAMADTKIDTWPKCESTWNTYMTDKKL